MEKKLHCGDLFKRVLSLAMALVMLLSFAPVPHAHAADATYIVAGVADLCGSSWNGTDVNNQMTLVDGLYTKTFANVPEGESYQFKVVENLSSGTQNWYGDGENNITFNVTATCDVKVTFDASTKEITVSGDHAEVPTGLEINSMRVVGNGDGSWLNGVNWDPADDANLMTETSEGVYEITFEDVEAYDNYQVKFAANGSWAENWGGTYAGSGVETDAAYNSDNIVVVVPYELADVTLKLDLTNFDYATKTGAKFTVTVVDANAEPEEPVVENTYIIAGSSAAMFGTEWDPANTANKMSLVDGLYTKTYENVAVGTYSLKVTDGTWDNAWGSNGQNYVFEVSAACDVTVTFDEADKTVNVTGNSVAKVTTLDITAMYAVGNGSGNWLNGVNWNEKADANEMTETSKGVYEITYKSVPKGDPYEVKFAANGSWDDNWGGTFVESGVATDAVYNSSANIKFAVSYDAADVTLKLDLTNFNYSTKNGAKFTVTITEVEAEPTVDYYLVGNINGEDYTGTDYKFDNGELTVTFDSTSYVAVKTSASDNWYMTNDWLGEVTSATLYDGSTLAKADKLMVPGGKALTFTLVDNKDGTLTLSYAPAEPEIPDDWTKVTIHFLKPETWGSGINAYVWTTGGALTGYEDYNTWPGKAVKENADHAGWYDLVVATEKPTAFNFIFNDGGNQTADLSTGEITGDTELWVVGKDVMTTAPGEWTGDYDYTANIYFQKPEAWGNTINAWIWDNAGNTITGYEDYHTTWPGKAIDADTVNAGWYNVSVTMDENTGFKFILNDGTNKTDDLETGELQVKTDIWVVNGIVQKTAPEGWVDPNRTVHVPGTFPGPSWDAASNQMTYDPELGLYVYTFEDVPPANYEFKIAINGGWGENYGVGGVKDGGNIAVAVPETMDVTVYYNDETHLAVTSVTYKFLDIDLSGTGIPEGTKMTDKDLTGIYKATVTLPAGEYSDIKMSIVGGAENTFNAFELEEEKDVTFFYDPASGLYYHNAIPSEIDETKVYFDSQDVDYKAPFGSPATGEEVTFSIDTGAEVQQVSLVITGKEQKTVELTTDPVALAEADGITVITWTGKVALDIMGEYDYYFVLSDGSAPVVYCDDDGFYGEGQVTDLSSVMPYDLVVHKAGFETPDWMKNAVIYQIFPDRFFDGDETNNKAQTWARGTVDYEYITDWYTLPENPEQKALLDEATYKSTGAHWGDGEWSNEIYGGDLEGITERIDYLKALGVNVIYLNPVFWSISSHRYDAVDYTEIDPILGTLGDFEELVRVAEANDMHIILDGVFNHVSDDSVYFDRYYKFLGKSEKIGAYPYWAYVYDYMAENKASQADAEAAAKAYFSEEYGITDYSYTEWFEVSSTKNENGVYSYQGWWGYDSMPIIKSTNGSEYQTGNWAEEIIYNEEGTSVTQYWITKGNDGWRLDVANEVSDETWQNFRASVKALDSDVVIIGEIWDDATKYLMGDMYDSVMNYVFRNAVTGFAMGTSSVDTTKAMEKIRERYPEEAFYAMMNLVGSHDTTRILSYLDGIGDDRADKSMAAAFPTYENTSDLAKQRQYLVSFLQFTYAGAPTIYYGDEIGMVGADDPDDRRAFEWGKGNRELVEWYAKLAAIREAYPALRTGSVQPIDTENTNVMGYARDNIIVLANNASSAQTVAIEGTYVDVLRGDKYTDSVNVPALNGVILVAEEEVKEVIVNTADLAPAYDSAYIVAERSKTPHSHTYDQKVVDAKYLASEADCENAATYYYSCTCGEKGTETFTDGEALGHNYEGGECTRCGEDDPNSVPATPIKPAMPNWKNWMDKYFNKWWDKDEKPEEPSEPETSEPTEPEETEPEETEPEETEPEETVPSKPITPAKPNWGSIIKKIFGWWKK